jgi:hypothetical protein
MSLQKTTGANLLRRTGIATTGHSEGIPEMAAKVDWTSVMGYLGYGMGAGEVRRVSTMLKASVAVQSLCTKAARACLLILRCNALSPVSHQLHPIYGPS